MTPRLSVVPGAESARSARLSDFVEAPGAPTLAVHALSSGERWLVRAETSRRPDGSAVRQVDHFAVSGPALAPLDRIRFEVWDDRFAETERYRAGDPRNLHPRPIELPAVLDLDVPVAPLPGSPARVRLAFAGPARLELGDAAHDVDAVLLVAEHGGERHAQWLARGVGEVALGPHAGPLHRWLVAFDFADGSTLFGGVGPDLRSHPLPPLPDSGSRHPDTEGLFR